MAEGMEVWERFERKTDRLDEAGREFGREFEAGPFNGSAKC